MARKSGGVGIRYGSDRTPPATKSTQPATKKSPTTRGPMAGKRKGY